MTAFVPVVPNRTAGIDNTVLTAVTANDTFPAGPSTYLRIKNGNAATCTVTITPPTGGNDLGTTVAPINLGAVAATTGDRTFGPFPANPFADQNGNVNLTYSVTASVSAQVLQMG